MSVVVGVAGEAEPLVAAGVDEPLDCVDEPPLASLIAILVRTDVLPSPAVDVPFDLTPFDFGVGAPPALVVVVMAGPAPVGVAGDLVGTEPDAAGFWMGGVVFFAEVGVVALDPLSVEVVLAPAGVVVVATVRAGLVVAAAAVVDVPFATAGPVRVTGTVGLAAPAPAAPAPVVAGGGFGTAGGGASGFFAVGVTDSAVGGVNRSAVTGRGGAGLMGSVTE